MLKGIRTDEQPYSGKMAMTEVVVTQPGSPLGCSYATQASPGSKISLADTFRTVSERLGAWALEPGESLSLCMVRMQAAACRGYQCL